MSDASPDLELIGIDKAFAGAPVVRDMSLAVRPGEFLALLGPSGSGKSTLLKLIAGFEAPDRGVVRLQGQDMAGVPPWRRNVNTVFQSYALFPHMTVFDNIAYGLRRKGVAKPEIARRVAAMLRLVALEDFGPRMPETLSGGEQQRVAMARALVNRPAVLLLDEPLSALDLKIRRRMQLELKRIHQEVGTTFIHVTHDQEEALVLADRIAVLRAGRCEQIGSGEAIYGAPASRFVADFIGQTNWLVATYGAAGGLLLPDGTVLRAPPQKGFVAGRVELGVRPERIGLADPATPPAPGVNRLPARLRKVIFEGPSLLLEAETAWQAPLAIRRQLAAAGPPAPGLVPGDAVLLEWEVASTMVFAAG
ncbi:spermidine/putrescine import ATP-binding protein PotA [Siccirubricoccus deserti]|uniref:ABC transporter ATP-binding protein n=1 Tax=Siccirubricoccus deserti TaxID=2013562 RepID=A0A9X0UBH6_9PROT|nr:ABC transporter ATP-binding protein [Siccirubricoccus deserti]MBC4013992.1 ABC transporter ATP-binding protein [Siccirubricoccus deserti]GGC31162.1 spermidine/putrescine import ATP-binding protein PotA [Siccirubricoccus deserti]